MSGERLVAFLLVEQLSGDQGADALRAPRPATRPRPRGRPRWSTCRCANLGALAVGEGDDLGAGGQRHLAAVNDLLRVAAVAAGDDE